MTTPLRPSGIPWWVTQSMASSASRRSSERRRTTCTPGATSVPLPVTILKPRLSATPSGVFAPQPEMTRASFGSATRHMILKTMKAKMIRATTAPAAIPTDCISVRLQLRLHRGDDDGARGVVLDHDDAAARLDGGVALGRVGVDRLAPAPNGNQ